ncbi:MotA/TolQ/ExbB proton channel family protein [Dasania marina]|uniref:MotA/TolQ/ExbB proton channel family protein n=1 Tax=Dasania marina TaxID=471499 RepID=UPI00037341EA|nr:MotA/TolQ/ExbB proton channel family protein [Dasania marina]
MKTQLFKSIIFAALTMAAATTVVAQDAKSLDQLLGFVKQGQVDEAKENKQREAAFRNAKAKQGQLLSEAKAMRTAQEKRSAQLEGEFEKNELRVADKQRQLKERLGTLTELFGHLTSTAGDLRGNFGSSLVSAQFPNREAFLDEMIAKMSGAEKLPSIEEIERLWFELQREMTESGRIVTFDAEVSTPSGDKSVRKVLRVGSFNMVTEDGKYLQYVAETGGLNELARQPSGPKVGWAADLAAATDGFSPFGVDPTGPTGGTFLSALINTPTLGERFDQGGQIGMAIGIVGVFAILLAVWRLIVLTGVNARVNAQLKSDKANTNNPLGRVLMVHEQNPTMDTETLELKLSEAILREIPNIEFGLNLLKIIAAIAPLMGLLGTVTGMIITFQAITIFGAGDPKAMAGGISGALVTTVLGLLVAIPTVLLHTVTNGQAKKIIHVLDEQSTGLIAEHTEAQLGKA